MVFTSSPHMQSEILYQVKKKMLERKRCDAQRHSTICQKSFPERSVTATQMNALIHSVLQETPLLAPVLVSTSSSLLHFHARLLNSPGVNYKAKGPGGRSSMEFPFYHGNITRKTCEDLLSKKGKNGSFLLRESESMSGALCLCVFFEKFIYTYRIFREHEGYLRIQTSEDVPQRVFKTIKDLIYTYEKPNQGLIINLRYPVKRPKPPRRVRHSRVVVDADYDEVEDQDYVDVLP